MQNGHRAAHREPSRQGRLSHCSQNHLSKREQRSANEPVLSPDLHSPPQQPVTREINNWLLSPVQSNPEKKSWSKRLAKEI